MIKAQSECVLSIKAHSGKTKKCMRLQQTVAVQKFRTFPSFCQRDGIYRVGILEHFLPKSKQTPKPLIS